MDKEIEQLGDLLQEFQFCQFVTISPEGEIVSRPMTLQEPRPDSPIWFVASQANQPATNLLTDSRVNLSFHRQSDHAWISMSGTARLNGNPRLIQDLWRKDWDTWFSDQTRNEIVLLEIEPSRVTFWEPEKGQLSLLASILKAKFTGAELDFAPNHTCYPSRRELSASLRS
jgi:general stress protein 26